MIFSFGPLDFRYFSGDGWSYADGAIVTNRKGGEARRETVVRVGFKSEHLTDRIGEEDPTDSCTIDGVTYYGKVTPGVDGKVHVLTAHQVAAAAIYKAKLDAQRREAAQAAAGSTKSSSNGAKPKPAAA